MKVLQELMTSNSLMNLAERLNECKSDLGIPRNQELELSLLNSGTYHDVYVLSYAGNRLVVRTCKSSQWGLTPPSQLKREYKFLEVISTARIAPQPVFMQSGENSFMVQEFVDGRSFDFQTDVKKTAHAMAKLHLVDPYPLENIVQAVDMRTFCLENGQLQLAKVRHSPFAAPSVHELQVFAEELPAITFQTRNTIVHTDLICSNIFSLDSTCKFIDWEGAQVSSPIWDLAYFISPLMLKWKSIGSDDRKQISRELVHLYASATQRNEFELRDCINQMMSIVVFRALCWCVGYWFSSRTTDKKILFEVTTPEYIRAMRRNLETKLYMV